MKLKTSDVPQADSLALVRRVLEAIAVSPSTAVKDVAEKTKFSERHVRYRLQAARILGFLQREGEPELTPRAKRLLATETGSPEEKKQLVSAISDCASVQLIAPHLLTLPEVDVKKLGDRITRLSGLSPATAERRAVVLRSSIGTCGSVPMAKKLRPWLRRFHDHLKDKKEGDIITAQDLMSVTEWTPVTLRTHVKKNALASFL